MFDGRRTPAENVERDEALLRRGTAAVRVAVLSARAVCLGVGQRGPTRAAQAAEAERVPVVRRASGGSGLLHEPGDLAWALVLPKGHPMVGPDFVLGFGRLGAGAVEFLRRKGRTGRWEPSRGSHDEFCVLGPRGSVLVTEGRILGGAAQHLAGPALLHHGVLQGRIDPEALGRFFGLGRDQARAQLIDLESLGLLERPEEAAQTLLESLASSVEAYRRP